MEDVVLKWFVSIGLPIAGFYLATQARAKENERRVTLIETKVEFLVKKDSEFNTRLTHVENNYAMLVRLDERMKTLFNQNEEIKQDIKTIKSEKTYT